MTSFVALYRGPSIEEAEMIAVIDEPKLVAHIASDMLSDVHQQPNAADPVLNAVAEGRRQALQIVTAEAGGKQPNALCLVTDRDS